MTAPDTSNPRIHVRNRVITSIKYGMSGSLTPHLPRRKLRKPGTPVTRCLYRFCIVSFVSAQAASFPVAAAVSSIRSARLAAAEQRRLRARTDLPMAVLDVMLEELEQMNLSGLKRVPRVFEARIEQLVGVLGAEAGELPPLRTNIAPVRLMDMVFDLQDRLLEARSGMRRDELEEPA